MIYGLMNVADFLVSVIFGLYSFTLILRFFLQWVKADFYNPVCQIVFNATNFFVLPLRKIIPGVFQIDLACIVAMYFVFTFKNLLLAFLKGIGFNPIFIFVQPFLDIIFTVINMYIYLIIIRAIMSWFVHSGYNPILISIIELTEPLLSKTRKIVKPISGFDFSPIIIMIGLFCVQIFLQSIVSQLFN